MTAVERADPPIRLLLVEDEPANRALVHAIVAKAVAFDVGAFELVDADGLEDARRLIARDRFDALLLDVHLPDGNGLDLIAEVIERGRPRPWIVVLSASVHPDDRLRALAAGADVFVGKPIDALELIDILGRVKRSGSHGDSDERAQAASAI